MAYRCVPGVDPLVVNALRAAQTELWLAEALAAEGSRKEPIRLRLGYGGAMLLFVSCTGSMMDSGRIVAVGAVGLAVVTLVSWWLEREERALQREALRRGLPRYRLNAIRSYHEQGDSVVQQWRRECRIKARWISWWAGEPLTREQCVALAEDLETLEQRDPQQEWFVHGVRAGWDPSGVRG
ncbi:MAG: hypothetical protein AAGF11_03895 [Myxococcota bacterium]